MRLGYALAMSATSASTSPSFVLQEVQKRTRRRPSSNVPSRSKSVFLFQMGSLFRSQEHELLVGRADHVFRDSLFRKASRIFRAKASARAAILK